MQGKEPVVGDSLEERIKLVCKQLKTDFIYLYSLKTTDSYHKVMVQLGVAHFFVAIVVVGGIKVLQLFHTDVVDTHKINYSVTIYNFLVSCVCYVTYFSYYFKGKLRVRDGTLLCVTSFSSIAFFIACMVSWTGGVSSSIFTSCFVSLIGIALFMPEDYAIKIILTGVMCFMSIGLLCFNPSIKNAVFLIFSGIANGSAGFIKFILNEKKEFKKTNNNDQIKNIVLSE
jgi:hypothetical protein